MVKTMTLAWACLCLLATGAMGAMGAMGANSTGACARALHQLALDIAGLQPRALRMAESSEWLPRGLLAGQTVFLGRYDECLATEEARYCLATLCLGRPGADGLVPCPNQGVAPLEQLLNIQDIVNGGGKGPGSAALRFGLCLPAACVGLDLHDLPVPWMRLYIPHSACRSAEDPPRARVGAADWTAAALLAGLMLAAATARRRLQRQDPNSDRGAVASQKPQQEPPPPYHARDLSLPVLDGLRVLSTYAVITSHSYFIRMDYVLLNPLQFMGSYNSLAALPVKSTIYSVDTFFLLSGLLATYAYLNRARDNRATSWVTFYLHRLIRLWPAMVAMLLLSRLLPMLEAGPVWWEKMRCEISWAEELLFVANKDGRPGCVAHLWYLSSDTQMYFFAPLALVALRRRPRRALQMLTLLIAGGVVLRFYFAYRYRMTQFFPALNVGKKGWVDGNAVLYRPSYARYSPFVVGILLGYALHKIKYERKPLPLSRAAVLGLWAACCGLVATVFLPLHQLSLYFRPYHRLWESLHTSASHTAWALALAIFILLAATGRGGPVGRFLSDPRWRPLSRISYAIYLVHMPLVRAQLSFQRQPIYAGPWDLLTHSLSLFVLSLPAAVLLSKLFEEPVGHLERFLAQLFTRGDAKGEKKKQELGGKEKSEEYRRMV